MCEARFGVTCCRFYPRKNARTVVRVFAPGPGDDEQASVMRPCSRSLLIPVCFTHRTKGHGSLSHELSFCGFGLEEVKHFFSPSRRVRIRIQRNQIVSLFIYFRSPDFFWAGPYHVGLTQRTEQICNRPNLTSPNEIVLVQPARPSDSTSSSSPAGRSLGISIHFQSQTRL
jgi:hypothetical protein